MTAIPETLVESELFGYVRGAFTGADRNKKGFIEAAEGGTLFLDEIGDLAPSIQLKLLRFLETRQYYRVGEPTAEDRAMFASLPPPIKSSRKPSREPVFERISTFA